MKKLIEQIFKFGIVGLIAFLIDWGLLTIFYEALQLKLVAFGDIISATISFTASVVFNYIASMKYVFTHKQNLNRRKEFIIFITLSIIGLGINDLLIFAGTNIAGYHPSIVKIPVTAVVMVWNFVTRKIFLDNTKN